MKVIVGLSTKQDVRSHEKEPKFEHIVNFIQIQIILLNALAFLIKQTFLY